MSSPRCAYTRIRPSVKTIHGIDSENSVMPEIIEMIRNKFSSMMKVEGSMEIVQYEKTGEPEIVPPERIWYP